MFCPQCGANVPDGSVFCMKCGTNIGAFGKKGLDETAEKKSDSSATVQVVAPTGSQSLKCPQCGAPITPKFGEMIISCEYCGSAVALGNEGWRSIQKQTMLPLRFSDQNQVKAKVHDLMDQGLLHRHLQERSTLEEMNLSLIPYWIIAVSARTSITASDVAAEAGQLATVAALAGIMGSVAMGGRGRGMGMGGFAGPMMGGAVLGTTMGAMNGNTNKVLEMDGNYNFPIVALKAFHEYQPRDYQFRLEDRTFFDMGKMPQGIKVLNGDIGEEAAKYQAKTLVDQLQSDKAHAQYHMIQQLKTQIDVSDGELLRVPIWFVRYDFEGRKIVLIFDGNSGGVVNSVGL